MARSTKLKIDQEAIIEFSLKYKDQLMVGALTVVLLVGGWFVYTETAPSEEDYVREVIERPPRVSGSGGAGNNDSIDPEELLQRLTERRERALYSIERNPFGSPEEQMRRLEEVQAAYNRGVELFNAGQFDQAVRQFDRVIALDVTESRMSYPIQPSEYKMRAMQENARRNLDAILSEATDNIAEGDRRSQQGQREGALEKYTEAYESLGAVRESDPDGSAIGQDNLRRVEELYLEAYEKAMAIRGEALQENLNRDLAEARTLVNSQDYFSMWKVRYRLVGLGQEIETVDPNANLVSRAVRTQLSQLVQQINSALEDSQDQLLLQAEQSFNEAIAGGDLQASQEALGVLTQFAGMRQDQELNQRIQDFRARRAQLVISNAREFAQEQRAIIESGEFDRFDIQGRNRFIAELTAMANVVREQNVRDQISEAQAELRALSLPPLVTDDYEIISIRQTGSNVNLFQVELNDRSVAARPTQRRIVLNVGRQEATTRITLTEVDTEGGFVILSKPGYRDAQVPYPQGG